MGNPTETPSENDKTAAEENTATTATTTTTQDNATQGKPVQDNTVQDTVTKENTPDTTADVASINTAKAATSNPLTELDGKISFWKGIPFGL